MQLYNYAYSFKLLNIRLDKLSCHCAGTLRKVGGGGHYSLVFGGFRVKIGTLGIFGLKSGGGAAPVPPPLIAPLAGVPIVSTGLKVI